MATMMRMTLGRSVRMLKAVLPLPKYEGVPEVHATMRDHDTLRLCMLYLSGYGEGASLDLYGGFGRASSVQ